MSNERFTVRRERQVRPNAHGLRVVGGRQNNGPRISAELAAQLETLTDPTILGVILRMKDGALAIVGDVEDPECGRKMKANVGLQGEEARKKHSLHQGFLIPMRGVDEVVDDSDDLSGDFEDDNVVSLLPDDSKDASVLLHRGGDVILKRAVESQLRQITHPAILAVILSCLDDSRAIIDVRKGMQKGIVTPDEVTLTDNVFVYNELNDSDDLFERTKARFESLAQFTAAAVFEQICHFVDHEADLMSPRVICENVFVFDDSSIAGFCMTNGYEVAFDGQGGHLQPRGDALTMLLDAVQLGVINRISEKYGERYDQMAVSKFVLNFNNTDGKFFIAYKVQVEKSDVGRLSLC